MPSTQGQYLTPISPNNMRPTEDLKLAESGTVFFWDIGTLEVSSYQIFLSNNINGHIIGHVPIADEQLFASNTFNGNTFAPDEVPQGYAVFYVTLAFTSAGQTNYLQNTYSTDNLRFLTHAEGDVLPAIGSSLVKWSSSGSSQTYTFSILDQTETTTLFQSIVSINEIVIPSNIIQQLSTGLTVVFKVVYGTISSEIKINLITTSQIERLFLYRYNQEVTDQYKYPGYINTYRDGQSNRYAANPSFKRKLNFTVPVIKQDAAAFILKIRERGEDIVLLPLWQHEVIIASVLVNNYTIKSSENLSDTPLAVGSTVLVLKNNSEFLVKTVQAIGVDQITLDQSLDAYSIIPLENCQLKYKSSQVQSSEFIQVNLSANVIQNKPDYQLSNEWVGTFPIWATTSLINYAVNNSGLAFSDIKQNINSKVKDDYLIKTARPLLTITYEVALASRNEIGKFFHLLTQLRGVQEEFVHPIPFYPLDIITVNLGSIVISSSSATAQIPQELISYFIYADEFRAVTSTTTTATTIEFFFASDFSTIVDNKIIQVGFLCRLASETVSIKYLTPYLAKADIKVTEIPE
jgi:hypothetical protein